MSYERGLIPDQPRQRVSTLAWRIMTAEAKKEGIMASALRGHCTNPRSIRARNAVILELRYDRDWTEERIGKALRLHHSTVSRLLRDMA